MKEFELEATVDDSELGTTDHDDDRRLIILHFVIFIIIIIIIIRQVYGDKMDEGNRETCSSIVQIRQKSTPAATPNRI